MIKKYVKGLMLGLAVLGASLTNGQQVISDFEDLPLDSTGYWNGADLSGGFLYGYGYFENSHDTTWGSWSGFVYSNLTNTGTVGWGNQYSTYAGEGYNGSNNFALMNVNPYETHEVKFAPAQLVQGFYITNTTYAALSMKYGDSFAKTFGADTLPDGSDTTYTGDTVTTADWFKLTVYGVNNGVRTSESVEFYLADYRFADDVQDYIVDDWNWLDLTPLGEVDALQFELASSDTGQWGMNTPAYFCMDDLTVGVDDTTENTDNTQELLSELTSVYPNPARDVIYLKVPFNEFEVLLSDNLGRQVLSINNKRRIDVSALESGIYFISIEVDGVMVNKKLIKE